MCRGCVMDIEAPDPESQMLLRVQLSWWRPEGVSPHSGRAQLAVATTTAHGYSPPVCSPAVHHCNKALLLHSSRPAAITSSPPDGVATTARMLLGGFTLSQTGALLVSNALSVSTRQPLCCNKPLV